MFNISIAAECGKNNITIKFNKQSEDEDINEVIFEYNNESKQKIIYKISLDETGDVVKITKNDEEDTNKEYAKEIKQLLYEDKDNINQYLIDNIEYELDTEQTKVFKKIKDYLGIVKEKEEKKEEKNKEKEEEIKEKKDADNKNGNTNAIDISNKSSNTGLEEANTRKWFGRYTDTDGREYFSCFCCDIPL